MKTKLNIGCGNMILKDHVNLDRQPGEGVDVLYDLECGTKMPYPDNNFKEVKAFHILEHIWNILPLMQELHRVTAPDGELIVRVPYGNTMSAFDDPTHIRQFFPQSFGYFGQPNYHRADYGYRGDWEIKQCGILVKHETASELQQMQVPLPFAIKYFNEVAHELICIMRCVKPIRPMDMSLQKPIQIEVEVVGGEDGNQTKN